MTGPFQQLEVEVRDAAGVAAIAGLAQRVTARQAGIRPPTERDRRVDRAQVTVERVPGAAVDAVTHDHPVPDRGEAARAVPVPARARPSGRRRDDPEALPRHRRRVDPGLDVVDAVMPCRAIPDPTRPQPGLLDVHAVGAGERQGEEPGRGRHGRGGRHAHRDAHQEEGRDDGSNACAWGSSCATQHRYRRADRRQPLSGRSVRPACVPTVTTRQPCCFHHGMSCLSASYTPS